MWESPNLGKRPIESKLSLNFFNVLDFFVFLLMHFSDMSSCKFPIKNSFLAGSLLLRRNSGKGHYPKNDRDLRGEEKKPKMDPLD